MIQSVAGDFQTTRTTALLSRSPQIISGIRLNLARKSCKPARLYGTLRVDCGLVSENVSSFAGIQADKGRSQRGMKPETGAAGRQGVAS